MLNSFNITNLTSELRRRLETVCRQHYSMNNHLIMCGPIFVTRRSCYLARNSARSTGTQTQVAWQTSFFHSLFPAADYLLMVTFLSSSNSLNSDYIEYKICKDCKHIKSSLACTPGKYQTWNVCGSMAKFSYRSQKHWQILGGTASVRLHNSADSFILTYKCFQT